LTPVNSARIETNVSLPAYLDGPDGYLWMHQGHGIAGWGTTIDIDVATGEDRFAEANEELMRRFGELDLDHLQGGGPVAFGSFTFDPDAAGSRLVIPTTQVDDRRGETWLTVIDGVVHEPSPTASAPDAHDFKIRYAGSTISEVEWLDAVTRAVKSIHTGDLTKVVLARDILIWSKEEFDVPILLGRLARRFPECYTFAVDGLVGASPELLIRRSGRKVTSLVLAGTAPRGDDDEAIGRALMSSEKDRDEHDQAVASVRAVLGALSSDLDVSEPELLQLPNVQHIATRFEGELEEELTSLEIAGALHPTAAVGGTPTDSALEVIRSLEGMERGRYAGPVGWMDATGDGEWAIALRCAEIDGARGRLLAGNGMVAASEPEAELEETRLKFRAMMSVLEGA
jgi:menaquinone-specific isochorismate synthase